MLRFFSHWQLPLVCAFVWWGMLIAMLIVWSAEGRPRYGTNEKHVTLVYISDVGGYKLKALFIPCAAVQGVFFTLSLIAERYLRHAGRLPRNLRRREKLLSAIAILLSIPGQIGILLVAVFDEIHHDSLHYKMLILFLVCIGGSCLFTIAEFVYLDNSYPGTKRLRVSYVFKAIWLAVAIILAIGFAAAHHREERVVASVFEWFLAFWYGLYLLSLAFDLYPAFRRGSTAQRFEDSVDSTVGRSWFGRKTGANVAPPMEYQGPNDGSNPLSNEEANAGIPQTGIDDVEKDDIGELVYQNRRSHYNGGEVPTLDEKRPPQQQQQQQQQQHRNANHQHPISDQYSENSTSDATAVVSEPNNIAHPPPPPHQVPQQPPSVHIH